MTREELEKIYNEPKTTLTREKLNEIYSPAKTVKTSGTKATLSSHDLMERQKRNARVNQYKAEKEARNEANKIKSQQNSNKLMGIESVEVGAEKYNSAPINTVDVKSLSKTAENPVDKWLDPSYKLSKDEKKEAEAYVKQWRKENNAFKNNPYKTQEGTRELQKIAELESKLSKGTAAWSGFMNSIPFLNNIQDKVANSINDKNTKDVVAKQRQTLEASEMQNPGAALAGRIAGEVAKYDAGKGLLTDVGILGESGKITKGISKVIKNPKVAGSVANILGDTTLDVALDTIPHLAEDISKGDEKAGANALKNVGTNLAFNTLGEGIGTAVEKAMPHLKKAKKTKAKVSEIPALPAKDLESAKDKIAEQLAIYRKGELPTSDSIDMGELPQYMQNFGDVNNPTYMFQSSVKKTTAKEGTARHAHGLSDEDIANSVYDLNSPIAVMKSESKGKSGVIVSGRLDKDGNPIIIPVHMDKSNNRGTFNEVPSMYGKDKIAEAILRAEEKGNMLFKNKERVDDILSGKGLQSPKRDVPNDSFFNNSISKLEENVNAITDYKKVKIPNHDEMNKNIDKYVGMYGDDAAKSKALEFKQSVNRVIAENSEEAWEELIKNTNELDAMLQGKTYTFKNQKSGKNKSNVRQATYNNEIRDIFTYETDSISKEAAENALNNGKVSKARSNTLENSDINTADELKNQYLNEDNFKYQEISEKQSMEEATTRVGLNQEHWKNKLMAQDSLSGTDVDTMMLIYTDAVQKARQSGDDELWKEAGAIFKKIQEAGTKGGQLVQSFAKWSRNTPEGIVAESFRKAKEQTANIIGDKKAQKLIDDLYEDVQKEVYTLANVAYSSGVNSRAAQIAFAQIGKIINANTPKTVSGAVKTYLMDSMLLNFRTLISRNAGGNLGYNAMEFARQPITAAVDKGVSAITGKRTRTGWNADKISGALEGLAKGITDEVDDIRKGVHTAKSGENTVKNAIQLNAHALKGNNPVSNAINKIDDLTKHMLSIGDRPFYEAAYKQRMAELSDLKNKGLLGADIAKMSDAEFNAYAELSAKMDGLTATYQDKGDMAKAFGDLKKAIGQYSKGAVGFDALSQLAMPFTNTPGNIITRSLEYSPLGAIKNTANTINEVRKGDFNQQRFVDELGRNILGTGLFAGGIAAYDKGLMTGSYSDDKDMKNAQKNSGMQEYALRTNIDGKEGNFDISWIPVLGNNMIMAAATKEAYDKGENTADAINKAASASANALLNTSTLQGLNRVFGGNASYNTENNLFENAKDALTSGFGQAVPSTLRQIAQSKDTYERNLNDGDRPYWQNSMINSVPGLRETLLQPKVDNEGNLILQNQGRDLGSRVVENMISPGKYTEITHSPVNEESMRLFESTGNDYSFLPTASRSDITNDDFEPTDAQYREYQQKLGRYNSELAGALIDSSFYQALPDSEKESALQEVYKGMKAVAKMEMLPGYTSDDKIADAYKKGGVRSALAYIEKKKAFADAGIKSGKKAQEVYASGGKEGLEEYVKYKNSAESLGFDPDNNTVKKVYDTGGIPYLKQYSTYKSKADKDGNGRLKKEEVTSYLNASGLSQEEKRYWFSVLYTGNSPKNPY